MVRKCIYSIFLLVLTYAVRAQHQLTRTPNIILIIGDDISRDDIGIYGKNPWINTPHLDTLASKGFLFNHFFVTSSSCSPSRTSLLTGRYPHNTGAPELHLPLPSDQIYFPELLKRKGYFTALVGKWHEGENTRRAYDTLIIGTELNGAGGENQWLSVLQNRPKDKPFFLWLASFDAHRDWDDDKRFQHSPEKVIVPETMTDLPDTRKDIAHYYNEIERLDFYIGKLQSTIAKEGLANNTIIIFLGDNGRPFPGAKTRLSDRGSNTPLIVYIPNEKPRVMDALVSGVDIAPTILDFANTQVSKAIQGTSFKRLFDKKADDHFRNYIFLEHNWHDYKAYERAVRTNKYLYIKNWLPELTNQGPLDVVNSPSFKDLLFAKQNRNLSELQKDIFLKPRPMEELYDLDNDSLQQFNVAENKSFTKPLDSLRSVLNEWQNATKDDFPLVLTPDWYDRWNGKPIPTQQYRGTRPGTQSGATSERNKGIF